MRHSWDANGTGQINFCSGWDIKEKKETMFKLNDDSLPFTMSNEWIGTKELQTNQKKIWRDANDIFVTVNGRSMEKNC